MEHKLNYTTEQLLDRAYQNIHIDKKKVKLERPQYERKDGKGYIYNFGKLASSLNREVEELKEYFKDELNIDCTIKPGDVLKIDKVAIKGSVENIYMKYIQQKVMCEACKSIQTYVVKEERINYRVCNSCKSRKAIDQLH